MTPIDEFLLTLSYLKEGRNVLYACPGGVGKTTLMKKIASHYGLRGKAIGVTATTGVAAINLGGMTIHSWSGIRLAEGEPDELYMRAARSAKYVWRWRQATLLILDEVSMLGKKTFEKLEYVARKMRKDERPFGGLQLLFGGDFLQLPPVKDDWIFLSGAWQALNFQPIMLREPRRYGADRTFFDMLQRIRFGHHTPEDIDALKTRCIPPQLVTNNNVAIKPTRIYSLKADVDYINRSEMMNLPTPELTFTAQDKFTPYGTDSQPDAYFKVLDETIPTKLSFRVGAQVMLRANLDLLSGLANGTRGVVTRLVGGIGGQATPGLASGKEGGGVMVFFLNGEERLIENWSWDIEDKSQHGGHAKRTQIPLTLAFATTVHKSQGLTLDYAVIDLGPSVFAHGQAYVALSRVRGLNGLFLESFDAKSIRTSEVAASYSNALEPQAPNVVEIVMTK